jgi:zinc/manganese transport system substrate-binding protein
VLQTTQRPRLTSRFVAVTALLAGAAALAGCDATSNVTLAPGGGGGFVIRVVAAENFWGSIAAQLGGPHAHVTSIIANPAVDPHSYEPTTRDAEDLASAQFVIENGIGYDPWVGHLLAADDDSSTVLNVGSLLGIPDGGNPHRWYDPTDVRLVIDRIVANLQLLDPTDRVYFATRAKWLVGHALRPYNELIRAIRARFHGTKVGASESIFAMLAPALGLDLVTPPSFLKAISEGTDVSAADKETIDRQIANHEIQIYVYNSQNVTPDVQAQVSEAIAAHIPVATITETLSPANTSFEAWQTRELAGIEVALARAAGRRP